MAQAQGGAQLSFEVEVRMIESDSRDEPPPWPTWHKKSAAHGHRHRLRCISELLPVTNYELTVRARARDAAQVLASALNLALFFWLSEQV